jgi:PAS domain S-box-containing protein
MDTPRALLMRTLLGEAADEARVGILVYDENGKYLAANRAICVQLGYTLDELLELSPTQLSARSAKHIERGLQDIVRYGTASGTAKLRRKDGTTVDGRYIAARTTIAHLDYYVSFFEGKRGR